MRSISLISLAMVLGCGEEESRIFDLTIENVADPIDSAGGTVDPTFSPGWLQVEGRVFEVGAPASAALERLAESGDPVLFVGEGGGTAFPAGIEVDYENDPLPRGSSYTVRFSARPGDELSLATMLIQTNDAFAGIQMPLFDEDGTPADGDITSDVVFYDAGTETNEPLGFGENQPMNGSGGADEMGVVRPADELPLPEDMLRVQIRVFRPD